MRATIDIFLVAGNRLLREALAHLLRKKRGFRVCGASAVVPNILEDISAAKPDVTVMDSFAAAPEGCKFILDVRQRLPGVNVIAIDMDDDGEMFLDSIRAGAVGYLLREASPADVVATIRAVVGGQAVCPPRLCRTVCEYVSQNTVTLPSLRVKLKLGFTRRQQQLVPYIAQGLTNKEIGSQLNLSENTVKNHIHRMLQRAGADDRLAVVELARHQGYRS